MIYTASHVEVLLPRVFDPTAPGESAPPDPDMPRGTTDPWRVSDPWTLVADMEKAWRLAPLESDERKALFATYVLLESGEWVSSMMGVGYERMVEVRESGMALMIDYLNGRGHRVDIHNYNRIWLHH